MKQVLITLSIVVSFLHVHAQGNLSVNDIFSVIEDRHPQIKSFDAAARSLDEAVKGAKNWEPPLFSTGFWMVPYNPALWKSPSGGGTGMGQYMVSGEQMFPNRRQQNANQKYLQSLSSVETEKKGANLNELFARAKRNYYAWVVIKKKLRVVDQDEKVLDFMIKSAELRYQNNLGKIGSYYKAKAALGSMQGMRILLESQQLQRRIALNTLMNRDPNTVFDIDTSYTIKDDASYVLDTARIAGDRSDIKEVDRNIHVTYLQQDVERARLRPQFGIRFDHMFGFGGLPMQYSLMGMVRLPIAAWSSREARANIESLQWKAVSLNLQKQAMINEATGRAQGIKSEILSGQKQIRLFEESIIPALRKNLQAMQIAYENNTGELFELFDAWDTLNKTRLDYLDQLDRLLSMQVELELILEIK